MNQKEFQELEKKYNEIEMQYSEIASQRSEAYTKLMEKGIEIAKQRNLELVVTQNQNFKAENKQVVIYDIGGDEIDARNLIKLSQVTMHDTYLSYLEADEKFKQLEEKLKKIRDAL